MKTEYTEAEQEIIRSAKKKALKLLEYADRTRRQLYDKLRDAEYPDYAVEEALAYAESFHYIDDLRFAGIYIRSNALRKSRYELKGALLEKGVRSDVIETALQENEPDEKAAVKALFEKKYGHKDLTDVKLYEKAFRYFSAKGFSYETIRSALSEALSEDAEEEF